MPDSVGLVADAGGFVRRQCPRCQRQFKTAAGAEDGLAVARRWAGRMPIANARELKEAGRCCFYCGARAAAEAFLTPGQQRHVDAVAARFSEELRYLQLEAIWWACASHGRPTFVPIRPTPRTGSPAPEPNDLELFWVFCCKEGVKAAPGWTGRYFCPRCGRAHERSREGPAALHR